MLFGYTLGTKTRWRELKETGLSRGECSNKSLRKPHGKFLTWCSPLESSQFEWGGWVFIPSILTSHWIEAAVGKKDFRCCYLFVIKKGWHLGGLLLANFPAAERRNPSFQWHCSDHPHQGSWDLGHQALFRKRLLNSSIRHQNLVRGYQEVSKWLSAY